MTDSNDTFTPSDFVVPVVGLHDDGGCGPFLGTGVFVEKQSVLITCDHVLAEWDGKYGVVVEAHERLVELHVVKRDGGLDLAALNALDYDPPHRVPLQDDDNIILNDLVMSFEYGTTTVAGYHIHFSPANRLGNVTRFRNLEDRFQAGGHQMLELSFPALKGASGAPVFSWRPPFRLWGIVTANISYELLPVHVEEIRDEKGEIVEHTKFHLPQGLAIHVKHIRTLLGELNA